MAKKKNDDPYKLRADVSRESETTIKKIQGQLMIDGESSTVADAINKLCSEHEKRSKK